MPLNILQCTGQLSLPLTRKWLASNVSVWKRRSPIYTKKQYMYAYKKTEKPSPSSNWEWWLVIVKLAKPDCISQSPLSCVSCEGAAWEWFCELWRAEGKQQHLAAHAHCCQSAASPHWHQAAAGLTTAHLPQDLLYLLCPGPGSVCLAPWLRDPASVGHPHHGRHGQ